eukprot:symbB.v1.2.016678.t1/scaffold1275.1/size127301/6
MVTSPGCGHRQRVANGTRHSGSVLQWKRKFGWIEPDESLDHPEAFKNNWRIYVNVLDVSSGVLYSGARVSFFVYSDGKGLGAEDVQLEGKKNVMSGKGVGAPKFSKSLG